MNILYENRINWLLKEISKGFKISPLNIAIFFSILIIVILIFIYLSKKADLQLKKKLTSILNKKFRKSIKKLNLAPKEIDLLKILSNYTDSVSNKYLLLEDEHIFQSAARKLLEKEPERAEGISSLRVKLGYKKHSLDSIPHSTAQIIDGTTIKIISKNKKSLAIGKIEKITPDYLQISIKNKTNPIKKGKVYIAQFQYHSGIFYFNTYCIDTKNHQVFLTHSEKIKRIQRRNYYRKNIHIPVYISSKTDNRSYYSYTTNLGGGGASIKGSTDFFNKGEIVNIHIDISNKGKIALEGKIIDILKTKNILRISFTEINNSDRDKIIKYIFEH